MSGSSWKFISPYGKPVTTGIKVKMIANNGELLQEAALNGRDIARLPTFLV